MLVARMLLDCRLRSAALLPLSIRATIDSGHRSPQGPKHVHSRFPRTSSNITSRRKSFQVFHIHFLTHFHSRQPSYRLPPVLSDLYQGAEVNPLVCWQIFPLPWFVISSSSPRLSCKLCGSNTGTPEVAVWIGVRLKLGGKFSWGTV